LWYFGWWEFKNSGKFSRSAGLGSLEFQEFFRRMICALHPAFGPRFLAVLFFEKYAQGGFAPFLDDRK